MDGVGRALSWHPRSSEPCSTAHLRRARLLPRISVKPCHSPALLGGSEGAAWGGRGTFRKSPWTAFLQPGPQQSQRLGQEVSVRAGPGCSPWTGLRGDRREARWLINHESSHGSCPLLRPNGSRGLIIEQRAVVLHSDPSNPSRHHRHGKMDGNLVSRAWCSASVPLGTFSIGATDQLWRP